MAWTPAQEALASQLRAQFATSDMGPEWIAAEVARQVNAMPYGGTMIYNDPDMQIDRTISSNIAAYNTVNDMISRDQNLPQQWSDLIGSTGARETLLGGGGFSARDAETAANSSSVLGQDYTPLSKQVWVPDASGPGETLYLLDNGRVSEGRYYPGGEAQALQEADNGGLLADFPLVPLGVLGAGVLYGGGLSSLFGSGAGATAGATTAGAATGTGASLGSLGSGITGVDLAGAGLYGQTPLMMGATGSGLAGTTATSLGLDAGMLGGLGAGAAASGLPNLTGTALNAVSNAAGGTNAAANPGMLGSLATSINSALGTNLTGSELGTLLSGGSRILGGLLSDNAAQDAAQTSANAQLDAARIAAEAAKFKPVGVTTNFGQSTFERDAQGNVIGAGYTLSPQLKALQDQLMGAAPGMLNQFTGSQAATAPMGTAAQAAMNLGNQYLATSPQAQAQKYYDDQQAVMAAQRERDRVNLENRLMAQGRLGLATGGTSTGMMAANPEMEALYNAQRQQDLQLAAAATQGGMDYAKFGTGMVGAGGDLLKGMYGAQTAAFSPYQTALGGAQTIEGLGQNALDLSINLGKVASPAQSGQLLAQGMLGAAQTQQAAASSPWGDLLSGAGNALQNWQSQTAQQQQQQQFLNALASGNWGPRGV